MNNKLTAVAAIAILPVFSATAHAAPSASVGQNALKAAHKSKKNLSAHVNLRPDNIVVSGRRLDERLGGGLLQHETEARTIQAVSQSYISKQSPTQNVVNILAMMPSVNAISGDATGLASSVLMVRGLNANDIGWLLDGAPSLPPGAGNYQDNQIDSENLERLAIAPGSSRTDDPVTSSLGGTIYEKMRDPKMTHSAQVDFTYGTFGTFRGFIRGDTGEIGHSGIRAFVSYSNASTHNWYSVGMQKKQHVDFKVIKEFNHDNSIAFETSFSKMENGYYYYPTLEDWRSGNYGGPDSTYHGPASGGSFYKLNNQPLFYNQISILPIKYKINDSIFLDDTPYFFYSFGYDTGGSNLSQGNTWQGNQQVGVDLSQGTQNGQTSNVLVNSGSYGLTYIGGNNLKVTINTSRHNKLVLGYWYENYNLNEHDPVWKVDQGTGRPSTMWSSSSIFTLDNGSPYYSANYFLHYELNAPYIKDSLSLFHDRLLLEAGFKDVMVTRTVDNHIQGATPHQGVSENIPLPVFSSRFDIDRHNQVYLVAEGDYRQPFMGSTIDAFSISSGQKINGASQPKSEYAIKEEIGWRYHDRLLSASVALFNMNITNRLLTLNTVQQGVQVSRTLNAGGQTSRGVEAQIGTAPLWGRFTPYASFAYLAARQDNNTLTTDIAGNSATLATAGKTQISSPHYQAGLGLAYDDGTFFGNLNLKYIGSQYATLANDEKIPGYITDNITLGFRLKDYWAFKAPHVQLNLSNLTSSHQRIGVYGYALNAHNATSVGGSTIAGSSPSYYIQPGFAAMLTVGVNL